MRRLSILLGLPLLLTPEVALAQAATAPTPTPTPATATTPASTPPPAAKSATAAKPAAKAPARPAPTSTDDEEEIVVQGQKPRGSVPGDIPPEQTLSPADVRAYGVNNISDLLDQLAPQTTSGRGGQPVILLNGRRISSFSEIRDLPTEAISRVEILPEEVALKFGYSADQKVVNIVLRERFLALVGQGGATTSTEGGGTSTNPEANYIRIRGDNRFTVNLRYQENAKLRESQRDVTDIGTGQPYDLTGNVGPAFGATQVDPVLSARAGQPVTVAGVPASANMGAPTLDQFLPGANNPNTTDVTRDRTLKGSAQQISGNVVYARPVFDRSTLTLNGSLSYATGDSLRGLPSASFNLPAGDPFSPFSDPVTVYRYLDTDPLHQRTDTVTGHGGLTVNGDHGKWRWSVTGNYDYSDNLTRTQTGIDTTAFKARLAALDPQANPFAVTAGDLGGLITSRAHSISNTGNFQVLTGGPLFKLPAGDFTTNFKAGFEYTGFNATSTGAFGGSGNQSSDLNRRNFNGQVNFDLPITSRRTGFGSFLGNLSLNGNATVTNLSDFGTLTNIGGGFVWTPIAAINLIGSYTREEDAPTINQIGDPTVITPQVRVFDYAKGETVDVTQISGGTRDLRQDRKHVWKIGTTLKPFGDKNDLTLTANYFHTVTNDAIASLPEPTAALEAAFPGAFVRDSSGDLIQIDTRSVNFERERSDVLRLGVTFSISLKSIIQKKFEAWIAARRAGQNVPPPIRFNNFQPTLEGNKKDLAAIRAQFQQRGQQQAAANGQTPTSGQAATTAGQTPPTQIAQNGAPPPPPADAAPPPGGPPPGGPPPGGSGFGGPGAFGGGGGRGGFGGGRGRGFGGGGLRQASGRLQVAIYDNWTIRDDVLIRQGVPLLDLLNGDSVGAGGGQSEHQIQTQLGYSNNGLGVRLDGNYKTSTFVRGDGSGTTGDLHFSSLTTFNLRFFADMGAMPKFITKPWARGLRISFGVNNLFNQRQNVRDDNGSTPLRYQPAYLDPLGRTVSITIRKLVF